MKWITGVLSLLLVPLIAFSWHVCKQVLKEHKVKKVDERFAMRFLNIYMGTCLLLAIGIALGWFLS